MRRGATLGALLALAISASTARAASESSRDSVPPRTMAITFDDLPATRPGSLAELRRLTGRLLAHFEAFLAAHGYAVAPVTLDHDESLDAVAYDHARARGDGPALARLGRDYLRSMGGMLAFHESLSRRLFGREIPHVLLPHANMLNAEYLDELAGRFRARGYRFVPLDEALADPAYRSRDSYVGPRGPSWLQRWAITRGEPPGEERQVPAWVVAAARAAGAR